MRVKLDTEYKKKKESQLEWGELYKQATKQIFVLSSRPHETITEG